MDRGERVGDNWRKRYHALTLHNQVHVNHLPYMPFPPNWPVYIPKDKLANWFEAYAEAMELNYWTGTEFEGGRYDEAKGRWQITVTTREGRRSLHPRHVVLATGVTPRRAAEGKTSLETWVERSWFEDTKTTLYVDPVSGAAVTSPVKSSYAVRTDLKCEMSRVLLLAVRPDQRASAVPAARATLMVLLRPQQVPEQP